MHVLTVPLARLVSQDIYPTTYKEYYTDSNADIQPGARLNSALLIVWIHTALAEPSLGNGVVALERACI